MGSSIRFGRQPRLSTALAALALTAAFLPACGGGGSSGGATSTATPALSSGEITQKGSIFINGIEFETEGARLEMENEAPEIIGVDDSKLKVGMMVVVAGKINDDGLTGTADRIRFEDNIKGPVTAVAGTGTVRVATIMGQEVIFEDNLTRFDPGTGMPIGDDVNKVFRVSGVPRDDGKLQATFATKISDDVANFLATGGILEIKGEVAAHDAAAKTFTINGLTVAYAGATLRNLPAGGVANSLLVEVKGNAFNSVTNTLTAVDVEGRTAGLDDIAEAEVEGFLAGLNPAAKTFRVNGQTVNYASATFVGGIESELVNGVKVEAEGPISGGVLVADKVIFKESLRFEGNVAAKVGNTLTLDRLNGISVQVDAAITRGAAALAGVIAGDGVRIRAREAAGGTLVATRLEEISPVNHALLQGPVTSFSLADNRVTILGINVNTATIGPNDFKDHDAVMTKAAFYAALRPGSLVKARLDLNSGAWDQIEFQD